MLKLPDGSVIGDCPIQLLTEINYKNKSFQFKIFYVGEDCLIFSYDTQNEAILVRNAILKNAGIEEDSLVPELNVIVEPKKSIWSKIKNILFY